MMSDVGTMSRNSSKDDGRLNLTIATLQATIAKQTDQNTQLKESLVKVMHELELRGAMLVTEKEARSRAVVAREQAEGALEMTRQECESFRKRLLDAEALLSSTSSQRAQLGELEQSLIHAKEQTRLIHDSKLALDSQVQVINRDNESNKMKIVALEARIDAMTKEKTLLGEEVATLQEQVLLSFDLHHHTVVTRISLCGFNHPLDVCISLCGFNHPLDVRTSLCELITLHCTELDLLYDNRSPMIVRIMPTLYQNYVGR